MSEEEQKAIETLNNVLVDLEDAENGAIISLQQNEIDSIKILLNLINNQQKEIKSLTDENNFLKEMYRGTTEYKAIKKKVEELGWN